jgi:hypothetical protein
MRRAYLALGHIPRANEMAKLAQTKNYPGVAYFLKCFGSWDKAVIAAGFKPYSPKIYSTLELIQRLRAKGLELKRVPYFKEMQNPSGKTYYIRLGRNWKKYFKAELIEWQKNPNYRPRAKRRSQILIEEFRTLTLGQKREFLRKMKKERRDLP